MYRAISHRNKIHAIQALASTLTPKRMLQMSILKNRLELMKGCERQSTLLRSRSHNCRAQSFAEQFTCSNTITFGSTTHVRVWEQILNLIALSILPWHIDMPLPYATYGAAVRFAAPFLQTVPIVCVGVTHTIERVVGVGVSTMLPVGLTPTVISALPRPCWPSTTIYVLPRVPMGNPAAIQAL